MTEISVSASKKYCVTVDEGLLDRVGEYAGRLGGAASAAVVSDDHVFPLYGERVCTSLAHAGFSVSRFVFPHGEKHKSLATYGELLNFLAENRLTRGDLVIALGGGVVGDLAGFAAATYLRGIRCLQIPTTLLAMVDSSVGGKTAIDLEAGKNLAGCFFQPSRVLCDPQTLRTLPEEEYACGCAEVIKYALLGNACFFSELEKIPVREQYEHVISVCVGMKRDLVEADEFDRGSRQMLNLGHTFGHAIEACSGYTVPHGAAVAVGMTMIARAAVAKGFCTPDVPHALTGLLQSCGLPCNTDFSADALYRAALSDKKRVGGTIDLIVPEAIGRCRILPLPTEELLDWLHAGGAE
ncbi:MAG: 3-dehydroquinate synthase [Eubacteriales bacterium]